MTPQEQKFFEAGPVTAYIAGNARAARAVGAGLAASLVASSTPIPPVSLVGLQAASAQAAMSQLSDRNHTEITTSCFKGQIDDPRAARVGDATVKIVSIDPKGTATDIGSGVIVSNSGNAENPDNRILTAAHVARHILHKPANATVIIASTGATLATVGIAAANRFAEDSFADNTDTASLRTLRSTAAYRKLRGLPLAPVLSPTILTGLISDPVRGAPSNGQSGGPVVTDAGLVGLVTAGFFSPNSIRPSNPAFTQANILTAQMKIELPEAARILISVPNASVLKSLNAAGQQTAVAAQPAQEAILVGYPHSLCKVFETRVATADPGNPRDYDMTSPAGTPRPAARELAGWTNPAAANARFTRTLDDAIKTVPDAGLKKGLAEVREFASIRGVREYMDMALLVGGDALSGVSSVLDQSARATTDSRVRSELTQAKDYLNWMSLRDGGYIKVEQAATVTPAIRATNAPGTAR